MKMINPVPMQAGIFGAVAGAAMGAGDAGSPGGALLAAGAGFLAGAVTGGFVAQRDAKIARQENPDLRNKTQMAKAKAPSIGGPKSIGAVTGRSMGPSIGGPKNPY